MGLPTGTTTILYSPGAPSWPERTFALYMRQIQRTELENFLTITSLGEYDASLTTNSPANRAVKSLVRRRYPGGPSISVPASSRTVIVGPTIKKSTWPGRPITLERPRAGGSYNPAVSNVAMKVLQLTLEGSFPDFYVFCQANNLLNFILRTNNGRPILIGS